MEGRGGAGMQSPDEPLNRLVLSLLWKLVSDSAILTSARSSFHHCGAQSRVGTWQSDVLSEGGTSRLAEVVERSTRAGV